MASDGARASSPVALCDLHIGPRYRHLYRKSRDPPISQTVLGQWANGCELWQTLKGSDSVRPEQLCKQAKVCLVCAVYKEAFQWAFPGWETIRHDHHKGDGVHSFRAVIAGEGSIKLLAFYVDGDAPADLRTIFPVRPHNPSRSTIVERLEVARDWMHECDDEHTDCRHEHSRPAFTPSRILDLSPLRSRADLQLVSRSIVRDNSLYACLSYCWGKSPNLETTSANLDRMKTRIPWETLPQTFKDAVTVVKALNIRYLWIDSLCIVQDSKADWEAESSAMADIYQNAYVTIVAASAPDTSTGFLFPRSERTTKAVSIPLPDVDPLKTVTVFVERLAFHKDFSFKYNSNFNAEVEGEPLYETPLRSRAWCLQEHFLSARVLQFGSEEMSFECVQTYQCECGQRQRLSSQTALKTAGGISKDAWRALVEELSSRTLTYDTDRLPAMSGIAKTYNSSRKDTYLAGLWRNSLIHDLMWYSSDLKHQPGLPPLRYESYVGPSWSWISVNSRIKYDHNADILITKDEILTEILEATCTLTGIDPTGRISGGELRVRGSMLEAGLWPNEYRDAPLHKKGTDSFCLLLTPDHTPLLRDRERLSPNDPVLVWIIHYLADEDESWAYGLCLRQVSDDPDQYERIGWVAASPISEVRRFLRVREVTII